MKKWRENLSFTCRFLSAPNEIGSLFPSSKKLRDKILKHIATDSSHLPPQRYLEIGAGTGVFTEQIVQRLKTQDHLDIVEMNPKLCALLRKKFGHFPNVTLHEISFLDFNPPLLYHSIVSSLPFNSFEASVVQQIFNKFSTLATPAGYVSFFEYLGFASIKKVILTGKALENYRAVLKIKQEFNKKYPTQTDYIFQNLTPARTHHCKIY